MEKRKILVIDDEVYIVELLAISMKNYGYECIPAYSGEEGLALAKSEQPDLILLDIMLSDMDGMETCRQLKADPAVSQIPVIMLSARCDEADKLMGLETGADDYVTKPFGIGELFARIGVVLRRMECKDQTEISISHDV